MEACRCKICGNPTLVQGYLVGAEGNLGYGFTPAFSHSHVRLKAAFNACTSCGHIWASVAPEELRKAIDRHGRELAKQHLECSVSGPYRDVPDVPEARKAADGVAEIDTLMLAGNQLDATRRLRQLTSCTWDDAIEAVRGWVDLERVRKLALFGWRPKRKEFATEGGVYDHPMRDRLLDG